jgi:hypothetical protein
MANHDCMMVTFRRTVALSPSYCHTVTIVLRALPPSCTLTEHHSYLMQSDHGKMVFRYGQRVSSENEKREAWQYDGDSTAVR